MGAYTLAQPSLRITPSKPKAAAERSRVPTRPCALPWVRQYVSQLCIRDSSCCVLRQQNLYYFITYRLPGMHSTRPESSSFIRVPSSTAVGLSLIHS